ncbi:hypothetical protein [Zooshikella harenae]|uniref:Uncharacterized protein n=1 Tax=Zooshikella harenae TaxID=2827238 RepID=A0ABS5ZBL0_9GAMM|nr:hypothetical protein [Zooshikella harenae]MBU2711439.1 hypothetical protein [Zooshikella harenae]
MSKEGKPQHSAEKVELKLSDQQRQTLSKTLGSDVAKRLDSIVLQREGSSINSLIVIN